MYGQVCDGVCVLVGERGWNELFFVVRSAGES